jgi:hypothetical protein
MHTTIFTTTPSSKSILDTKSSARVVPRQGVIFTHDHARAAFQAALVIHKYLISVFVVGVQVGRAYVEAGLECALLTTDIVVDDDVRGLLVNLEDISPQLIVQTHTLYRSSGLINHGSQPPYPQGITQR